MSQITTGIRSLLSKPKVYELFQRFMGANKTRKLFISKFIAPYPSEYILDIGCGPAGILGFLPDVNYYGFDISEDYIKNAKQNYGDRGKFYAKYLSADDIEKLPKFDLVLLSGVLHHVDDDTAIDILNLAYSALKPHGRLVTTDGCFVKGQNPIARFLIKHDRGQNIKTEDAYVNLAKNVFTDVKSTIYHITWIPYTLCYLECTK